MGGYQNPIGIAGLYVVALRLQGGAASYERKTIDPNSEVRTMNKYFTILVVAAIALVAGASVGSERETEYARGHVVTWQNSAGYWFAVGPVQQILIGEKTEEKAIGYVTLDRHGGLVPFGMCDRFHVYMTVNPLDVGDRTMSSYKRGMLKTFQSVPGAYRAIESDFCGKI